MRARNASASLTARARMPRAAAVADGMLAKVSRKRPSPSGTIRKSATRARAAPYLRPVRSAPSACSSAGVEEPQRAERVAKPARAADDIVWVSRRGT